MRKYDVLAAIVGISIFAAGGPALAAPHTSNAGEMRETKALNLLEAKGYTHFVDFHKTGKEFAASVTENGKKEMVMVDPDKDSVRIAP